MFEQPRIDCGVGLALALALFPDGSVWRKIFWDTPRTLFGFA